MRRAFLLLLGCGLSFWGLRAPIGAQTAYSYGLVEPAAADASARCGTLVRGQRVRLWPMTPREGKRRVRLVDDPDCIALHSQFSPRPRPRLRPAPAGRPVFAKIPSRRGSRANLRARYTRVNVRREPDLDNRFLLWSLESPAAIRESVGLVTGSDGMEWLEAIVTPDETVYIKFNRLEFPADGSAP